MKKNSKKVLLVIRDGWGYSNEQEHNMIAQANTPYTDMLEEMYPTTLLGASGVEVGIPDAYYGNSEVGHMTIGAGRVIEQSLLRINNAIDDSSFFENKEFLDAINQVKENNTVLHLVGLLQKEGVHAHFDHLIALLELAKKQGLRKDQVAIHVITDGRDAGKQNAIHYLRDLELEISRMDVGEIMSLSGRYFAMDRNENWDRTEKYYKVFSQAQDGISFSGDVVDYILKKYEDREFSDEFLEPIARNGYQGISNSDSVIFYNFRTDRAAQLTHVFMDDNFSLFSRKHPSVYFVSMTEYYDDLTQIAFPELLVEDTLGQVIERYGKTQLRISETEKYSHVTYFLDAAVEQDFKGGKKIIIPSPDVPTFDLKPSMSSVEITDSLLSEMEVDAPDLIVCNFPNADMVGHSGDLEATKQGVEAVDRALERIVPFALDRDYTVILAADHGNAEHKTGKFETSHTHSPIPCTLISSQEGLQNVELKEGLGLKNIAATILKIMNIPIPDSYEKPIF